MKDRKCNIELYEDCRTRKLLKECNCVIWDLPGFQVKLLKNNHLDNFQEMQKCDLQGRDCVAEKSHLTFDCLPSCDGIYADVSSWWDWDPLGLKELIEPMLSEYENFKQNNVRHIMFKSSAHDSSMFGTQTNCCWWIKGQAYTLS